jgi:ribose/xylose/arabinose/galactoside ABC-type transport system permease subunit
MAMSILIISGEFGLSVGAIYAVAGVVTGLLAKHFGLEIWTAAGCGLASALILGLLNELLVTTTKINSFIATLSKMMVYRGIAMVLSQGAPHPMKLMFSWD